MSHNVDSISNSTVRDALWVNSQLIRLKCFNRAMWSDTLAGSCHETCSSTIIIIKSIKQFVQYTSNMCRNFTMIKVMYLGSKPQSDASIGGSSPTSELAMETPLMPAYSTSGFIKPPARMPIYTNRHALFKLARDFIGWPYCISAHLPPKQFCTTSSNYMLYVVVSGTHIKRAAAAAVEGKKS